MANGAPVKRGYKNLIIVKGQTLWGYLKIAPASFDHRAHWANFDTILGNSFSGRIESI